MAILNQDLPEIIKLENLHNALCMVIPRAKVLDEYFSDQLLFRTTIQNYLQMNNLGIIDGTEYVKRTKNTKTTHLKNFKGFVSINGKKTENDGELPYPGITKATCKIDEQRIKNQAILLIDDIYTKDVNIDEDCIQALYDLDAKKIILYTIACTKRFQ